jgi:hypothetical protein
MAVLPEKSRLTVRTMRVLTGMAALATDWVDDRPIPIAERSADLLLRTRSLDLSNQANQQLRNPWLDLRLLRLDGLGVVATVRWYAYHQGQRAGFAVHFAVELVGREPTFDRNRVRERPSAPASPLHTHLSRSTRLKGASD